MIIKSAEILCVGTEILIGDIVNTNAAYISAQLSELGISQYYQSAIGDNSERLEHCIKQALSRCDLLIITGGLGPTYDDLTKETVAKLAGVRMVTHKPSLERIKSFFESRNLTMTGNNAKQAMMPVGATVFENSCGTAPGMALEISASRFDDGSEDIYHAAESSVRTIILLPGPPHEMKAMFEDQVKPYLATRSDEILLSKNIMLFGISESAAEYVLSDMMLMSSNPTIAPYCGDGEVRLRVTARAKTPEVCEKKCAKAIEQILHTSVSDYFYGINTSLEKAVVTEACKLGLHVTTAESCTGGLTAGAITAVPGSSAVFDGGVVTYSNDMKKKLLGVRDETLRDFGAVSPETAGEMALGALELTGADISVSVTGIAGPGGGSEEKPVGLVYIAVASKAGLTNHPSHPVLCHPSASVCSHFTSDNTDITVLRCQFSDSRERVRTLSVKSALAALLSALRLAGTRKKQ